MAASLSDPQLTLPTEFLQLQDPQNSILSFPFDFHSFCSTETESSDDDDFLLRLPPVPTQHPAPCSKKTETKPGSPKSTLGGIGSWSISSNGSGNCELSPPPTPPGTGKDLQEPICDVSRLNHNSSFYSDHRYVYGVSGLKSRDQVNQQYPVWGRQQNQIYRNGISSTGYRNSRYVRPLGLPVSAWPPLQIQQNKHRSSTATSVFPAGSGAKRGCAGTGVFLPRTFNKSDGSAVLAPAKAEDNKIDNSLASKHDESVTAKNEQHEGDIQPDNAMHYELCLPQEWIY